MQIKKLSKKASGYRVIGAAACCCSVVTCCSWTTSPV